MSATGLQEMNPSEAVMNFMDAPLLTLQDIRIGNSIQMSWANGTQTVSQLVSVTGHPVFPEIRAQFQRETIYAGGREKSLLTFFAKPANTDEILMVNGDVCDYTQRVTIRSVQRLTAY
jgi:hypothetical protein